MKTKVLKSVLPMLAIVLAIGLAFANEEKAGFDSDYYDDPLIPGVQEIPGGTDCPTTGENPCFYNGFQVYDDVNLTIPKFERVP
ncbi:hypothetical protein GCM10007962_15240 [Yeosuana aromativorans]|uniref:Secreted protein n=1 Tax=Yeosuana aromativorans TaxID=288019 RepID=A0A8J3FJ36_9FLAO|nr:DUF6520 family protein [Yeosuana aromativorans]GGK22032.1 hypothetical protein GCM10007962_15240 [Yeosuana aromativorans]